MKKDYCTQNEGDCQTCSLVNYGRDCQNNPLSKKEDTATAKQKKGWEGFVKYAVANGIHNGPQTLKALAVIYAQHKGSKWDTIIELFRTNGENEELRELAGI